MGHYDRTFWCYHRPGEGTGITENFRAWFVCKECMCVRPKETAYWDCCPECGKPGHTERSVRFLANSELNGGVIEIRGVGKYRVNKMGDRMLPGWTDRLNPQPKIINPRGGKLSRLEEILARAERLAA